MNTWMPYLRLEFFTSEVGRLCFVGWALILVVCHMQYVHSSVDISRRFTVVELVADLIGLTWMRNICAVDFPEVRWLHVFLFVHFVVHSLSFLWAVLHWRSLDQHMMDFRRRRLARPLVLSEWIYEQSDTALYFVLAVRTLSKQRPEVVMAVVILTSAIAGSRRFKAWFSPTPPQVVTDGP